MKIKKRILAKCGSYSLYSFKNSEGITYYTYRQKIRNYYVMMEMAVQLDLFYSILNKFTSDCFHEKFYLECDVKSLSINKFFIKQQKALNKVSQEIQKQLNKNGL